MYRIVRQSSSRRTLVETVDGCPMSNSNRALIGVEYERGVGDTHMSCYHFSSPERKCYTTRDQAAKIIVSPRMEANE